MIFTFENLNIQALIWSYLRSLFIIKIAFQQLQGRLYYEFDSFHVKLSFLKVHFRLPTSNSQNLYVQICGTLWRGAVY